MIKVLKIIGNFFKSKKVQIWAGIMAGVIVVACCIASWIMIDNKHVFAQIRDTDKKKTFLFDFMPHLNFVDTITIKNDNDELSDETVQLNNNMIGGELDEVELKSDAKAIAEIMKRLDSGRKTNQFEQFFTGGQGGAGSKSGNERITSTHTGSWTFEEVSQGVSIKIAFVTPEFVVNRDDSTKPWRIEKYDPNYEQSTRIDEYGVERLYGQTKRQYKNSVINAIHIPLGNVKNAFTQQTWYLSVGSELINNTTTLGYTYTTYGNYHSLAKYVRSLDDSFFWYDAGKKKK